MESTDTRTLKIEIPGAIASSEDGINIDNMEAANGWTLVPTTTNALVWEGTIDLSGYVREFKTFYPSAAFTQEGGFTNFVANAPVTVTGALVATVVSTVPLNSLDILVQVSSAGGPGFLNPDFAPTGQGAQDWNTVLFAETQILSNNSTLPSGILQPIINRQSGSLAATAANTLYVMKMVVCFPGGGGGGTPATIGNGFLIPTSRVVIPGKFGKEPDVEYLMRLKRSVELANQV